MGKITKKKPKVRRRKKNLTPEFETACETALDDVFPKIKLEGDELQYRLAIQEHLLAVVKQILSEHKSEIIRRAEERITALSTLVNHRSL